MTRVIKVTRFESVQQEGGDVIVCAPDGRAIVVGNVDVMARARVPIFLGRKASFMHHRRFACGHRTCNLDGGNPAADRAEDDDTQDARKVTCPRCQRRLSVLQ